MHFALARRVVFRPCRFAAAVTSLVIAAAAVSAKEPPAETFSELRTEKGRTFVNAKVIAVEPDGLRLQHETGVSKVAFWELPEEVRKNYPHDPEKATEFAKAAEVANREAISNAEQERMRVEQAEVRRKAGIAPELALHTTGPITVEQVKARWLLSNASGSLNYGDRNYAAREAAIATYRSDVLSGLHDREAEKIAMRHNFEWYLREGHTEQAALAQKRLAVLEDEDLRREQIASMERLAKSVDRAAQGANSALLSELSSIRLELERLRLEWDSHP